MSIAPGKHELRIHIPLRTYEFLKATSPERGLGQFVSDCIEFYTHRQELEEKVSRIEANIRHILDHLAGAAAGK
jgi:hypothetical protein